MEQENHGDGLRVWLFTACSRCKQGSDCMTVYDVDFYGREITKLETIPLLRDS